MPQSLTFTLAWRFLNGSQSGLLIAFGSRFALCSLVLAVSVLSLVLSVMSGFEKEFTQRILGFAPHAQINFYQSRNDWQALSDVANELTTIDRAVAYKNAPVLFLNGKLSQTAAIQFIDIHTYSDVIAPFVVHHELASNANSSFLSRLSTNEILIGNDIADKLKLAPGDIVRVAFMDNSEERRVDIKSLKIAGLLKTQTEIDSKLAIGALTTGHEADGIFIQTPDVFAAKLQAYKLRDLMAQQPNTIDAWVSDWTSQYGNLYLAIQLSRQMVVFLLAAIIAVAAFNVFVILGMIVRQRQSQIAILKTQGLKNISVVVVFMSLGLMIAIPGGLIGIFLGALFSFGLPHLVPVLEQFVGVQLLNTSVYPISYLPTAFEIKNNLLILAVTIIISALATSVPALMAARVKPALALQYD